MSVSRSVAGDCGTPLVRRRRVGLLDLLSLWHQRRQLTQLDASRLDDIGLTEAEARTEARRAPWDVPQHWLR